MSDAFQSPAAKLYPPAFEFTKRKQWAGLLITELADAVNLILGATGKIWYCGPAVHELLGWRDEELIERNLIEFVHGMSPFDVMQLG
jgi:PAS domain-containing protein